MPSRRKSEIEELAEELLPGWRAVDAHMQNDSEPLAARDSADERPKADSTMPSMEKLRAKYGTKKSDVAGTVLKDARSNPAGDTAIVQVESGPLRKTVAISPSRRKVLWSQG